MYSFLRVDGNNVLLFFSSNKISDLPPDVTNAVVCLEVIMNSHEETREQVQKLLPKPLFDFKSLPTS